SVSRDATREANAEGYVPVSIELNFKNQPEILDEASLSRYIEGRFSEIVDTYTYVNEHILLTNSNQPDYALSKQADGHYTATVLAFGIPRHPTQLYESMTSLALCFVLFFIWTRRKEKTPAGLLLGLFLIILFGLRFVHELFKENQVAFEDDMSLNMGQILSIPLIIAGVFILIRALRAKTIEGQ
ncbi:MAG: prolipoprotein diacylglyceryl transferase, partial [Fulvivirga sp.]